MLHVFKHELRLIFRDPRFWIPFIIPPVILAASQAIAVSRYGGEIMQGMESYMMLLLGCLMAPMGAPLAGDSLRASVNAIRWNFCSFLRLRLRSSFGASCLQSSHSRWCLRFWRSLVTGFRIPKLR